MMNGTANNFTTPKNITTFILKNKTKEFLIYARYYNYITPINTNNFIIDNKQRSFNNAIEKLKPVFNTDKVNLELLILEQDLKIKKLEELKLKKDLGAKFIKNITINIQYPNSAVARIRNHLAYKLGQVLIINSKSILGYIRMPFILSFIKEQHKTGQVKFEKTLKENPNLALPPLESYADYKEALKEKECFTYKLGEAFIKAHKNWHKGGYLKFYFKDVPRIKKKLKK